LKNICVFGASSAKLDKEYLDCAFELGELLAKNGFGLVFGGGGSGLMGATARGVHSQSGKIIGVIPEKLYRPGLPFAFCDEIIITKTMHERKAKMESLSDGFIALPGGYGTIEELMEILTLVQLGYHQAPVVILNHGGYFNNLIAQLHTCVAKNFTSGDFLRVFSTADTPADALRLLVDYVPPELPDKIREALM